MNLKLDQFLDECFALIVVVFGYLLVSLFSLAWLPGFRALKTASN